MYLTHLKAFCNHKNHLISNRIFVILRTFEVILIIIKKNILKLKLSNIHTGSCERLSKSFLIFFLFFSFLLKTKMHYVHIISLILYEIDTRDIYIDFLVFIQYLNIKISIFISEYKKKYIFVRGIQVGRGATFLFSLLLEIGL